MNPTNSISEPLVADVPSAFSGLIGLASIDITPPVGIYARSWGAAKHDVASSIHRPLTFNVITFQEVGENSSPLVLIDADLGFWRELTLKDKIFQIAMEEAGVGPERVLFCLTHTHAGPRIIDSFDTVEGGQILREWSESILPAARTAVQTALRSSQPALLEWHSGLCQLAANRDLVDPHPEMERRICGYAPGVAADQTLLVGRVTDESGKIRAVLVNYACHPTTLAFDNEAISPDFIGAMRETITRTVECECAFFLQGASGELAPRYQYVADLAVADRHGRQLGYAALATLEDMETPGTVLKYAGIVESGAPLAIWKPVAVEVSTTLDAQQVEVELDLKDLPSSAEIQDQLAACTDRAISERLYRKLDVRQKLGEGKTFSMPVHGWRIGSAILVGTMAESYSLFQTEVRARFPQRHVVCLNIVNGWIGYLAPQELYGEDLYQVWQSPFAKGSLERVIEATIQLARDLIETERSVESAQSTD